MSSTRETNCYVAKTGIAKVQLQILGYHYYRVSMLARHAHIHIYWNRRTSRKGQGIESWGKFYWTNFSCFMPTPPFKLAADHHTDKRVSDDCGEAAAAVQLLSPSRCTARRLGNSRHRVIHPFLMTQIANWYVRFCGSLRKIEDEKCEWRN